MCSPFWHKTGYFKVEILQAYSPLYFDHKQKLSCINSAVNLIKILTADSQANIKVYNITTHDKKSITFVDTPGHEIFTPIRVRGGILSDIVIIIIAIDEGIKHQTIESINYAKKLIASYQHLSSKVRFSMVDVLHINLFYNSALM